MKVRSGRLRQQRRSVTTGNGVDHRNSGPVRTEAKTGGRKSEDVVALAWWEDSLKWRWEFVGLVGSLHLFLELLGRAFKRDAHS